MKNKTVFYSIILGLLMTSLGQASTAKKAKTPRASAAKSSLPTPQLSTDIRFGDQAVNGAYQTPFEALSVVENEKPIDELIGVRQNFQDRVKKSKGMR